VSVFAVRTSLKSVGNDFVEARVRRELARAKNEADHAKRARCVRKAVKKNRRWFGFGPDVGGQLWERHCAFTRSATSSTRLGASGRQAVARLARRRGVV
jgi:hypothetical protein